MTAAPVLAVLGDRQLKLSVNSLAVSQEEFMHDQFTAHISSAPTIGADDLKGYPASISWGSTVGGQTMVGYIDTVSEMDGDRTTGLAIIGLGASSHMRSGQARTWTRRTPLDIAREIVRPYRLGLEVDKYVAPLDFFMQTSESDWATLTALAQLTGMSLIADGAVVRLIDVRKELGRAMLRPTMMLDAAEAESFHRIESKSTVGHDKYTFTGVDRLGVPFSVAGGPEDGVERHAAENFASLEEALNAGRRWEDRQRTLVRSMCTFPGFVDARAGSVIRVIDRTVQYWYVARCKHEVTGLGQGYRTHMELHTTDERRPSAPVLTTRPAPVLRNGAWVSSRSYEAEL
jgi:hypothetical protein